MSAVAGAVLGGWLVVAIALGYVMRRRGFDGYVWMTLGLFLGPIAVAVAASFAMRPPSAEPKLIRAGHPRPDGLDVLVGFDGSPESEKAVGHVAALLGHPVARVTLARVVPRDASPEVEANAEAQLASAAAAHPELDPAALVLRGEPTAALLDHARRASYDLIVAGTRGQGRSRAVLGSVASSLAKGAGVPVLLVDDDGHDTKAVAS